MFDLKTVNYIDTLRQRVGEENIIFEFKGKFNHKVLVAICKLAESELESSKEVFFLKKRVVHLVIESLQNLIKHTELLPVEARGRKSVFIFAREGENYVIISGNTVTNKKAYHLDNYLEYLNNLNPYRLKKFYKSAIKSVIRWGRKGRMGLIEIAIKSRNKILHRFEPINEEYSYFTYKISISREHHPFGLLESTSSDEEDSTTVVK